MLLKRLVRARSSVATRSFGPPEPNVLESLLHAVLVKKDLTFVQIGANDGCTNDPLFEFVTHHHKRVRGLVVEPVKAYFAELVEVPSVPAIIPVNAAIHRTEKEMTIHRVNPERQRADPTLRRESHRSIPPIIGALARPTTR
jgi:hypothetical protein